MDEQLIETYFGDRLPEVLNDGSEYPLLLVVAGEKEGALTMNCTDEQIELLKEFCRDFNLGYRIGEGRKSKPSRSVGENDTKDQKGFFVSADEERFEMLEDGRFYGFSDRSVGKFLGFPDKAVRFFVENEQPSMVSRKKISEMKEEGIYGEELKFLNLVSYIPSPEKTEIDRGIEKGINREEALEIFDRVNNTDIGKKYVEKRLSRNLYR